MPEELFNKNRPTKYGNKMQSKHRKQKDKYKEKKN